MTNASNKTDILIVGSGMAGMTLVREVRKLDKDVTVHMITADDGAQYSKPMISNAFAQGKGADDLVQKDADTFAAEFSVTMWTHTDVFAINRSSKSVLINTLNGRDVIEYGQLVLAVGASPRPFTPEGYGPIPLPSVNSLDDYRHWRGEFAPGERILIVGAGLIGVEFSNDLVNAGFGVDVVDIASQPLGRLLPNELGQLLQERLEQAGVSFHLGRTIERMSVNEAVLDNGLKVSYDHALSAIGLVPNTKLAQECGLKVDQGILVDPFLMTSDPHIYALGDCAQTQAGVLPYVQPLMIEARALAKTLVDDPTQVELPALPVAVKTPALPTVVCPPAPGAKGKWAIEGVGLDRRAVFVAENGHSLGFVLTGAETKQRMSLSREMPALLAA
ncbi:MAG: FAD-dependent oxidoreductase [Magnetovibrio sp.]|nr:FAD-dependent oxidoreductase [Magnetovibrio sp.]